MATEDTEGNTGNLKPWEPGQSGNPKGRPKGSRNALGEDFLKALLKDFRASDDAVAVNGEAAIKAARVDKPVEYLKMIASLLPKEIDLKMSPIEEMDDAELLNAIRAVEAAIYATIGGTRAAEGGIQAASGNAETPALPALH